MGGISRDGAPTRPFHFHFRLGRPRHRLDLLYAGGCHQCDRDDDGSEHRGLADLSDVDQNRRECDCWNACIALVRKYKRDEPELVQSYFWRCDADAYLRTTHQYTFKW